MSMQTDSNPSSPSAQVVGNAFVEQYYHILHTSPELVHRFYQDSSLLSRPDGNGIMASVTTMQGINEKILSLNFKDYKAEIKTADAQKSYMDGVTLLVTGCLTDKDNMTRKFVQSFFLAPQDNGYFVLNDVFRYVEDNEPPENHPVKVIDSTPVVLSILDHKSSHVPDRSAPDPTTASVEEDKHVVLKQTQEDLDNQLDSGKESIAEPQSHSEEIDVSVVVESVASVSKKDAPKKSYASIVRVVKGNSGPTKVYKPTAAKVISKKIDNQSVAHVLPIPEPEASVPINNNNRISSNSQEEAEGHSIYIRNLPQDTTDAQLEDEFKKFGSIKPGGVQVRYNKQQRYCFGFVEFHSLSSMNNAIQASPMTIGGRTALIEVKRTTAKGKSEVMPLVGGGQGRYPLGRAGYRNESFRSRGNYGGGGRGFSRNDYVNRGEFSGAGGNTGGRGESHQRGQSRGDRSGGRGTKPNAANSL